MQVSNHLLTYPFRYVSQIPNVDNYICKVKYSLPFQGKWTTVNGGINKVSSHSWGIPNQRYAYDFIILDENGRSFSGDIIKRGQCIARCGNSGNSSEPHLHFQLQDGVNFYTSAGLPIEFNHITTYPTQNYSVFDPRPAINTSELVAEKYIMRGQSVSNMSILPIEST